MEMLPEELLKKTIGNTTNYYLRVKEDNRQEPRRQFTWIEVS